MSDTKFLRAFQDHTEMKLNSESLLQYVAIVSQRKQVKLDVAKRTAPHVAGRNGKVGAGILIGLPVIDPADNDVPGAQMVVKLPIDILVKDDLANLSNGAAISAEEVLVIVWQLLHQFLNKYLGSGNWTVAGADPIEDRKGAYGYTLVLEVRFGSDQPDKVATPTFSLAGGNVTLSPQNPGDAIYYTLDGSFPANSAGINPATHLYAVPFAVTSGQTVLWAAWRANTIGSDVWAETIP